MLRRIRTALFGSRRRKIATLAVTPFLMAGVAFAAWTLLSTGDGSGKVGSLAAITFAASNDMDADLMPNGTTATGTMSLLVTNPNPPMKLTELTGAPTLASNDTTACPSSNFRFAARTGLSITVPNGTSTVKVPATLGLADAAPQTCSGIAVIVKGVSAKFST